MMGSLANLFNASDLKDDLMAYGTMGVGAIGASVAWNMLSDKLFGSEAEHVVASAAAAQGEAVAGVGLGGVLPASLAQYLKPAAAILFGIYGGNFISRYNRNLGVGVAVGLVATGTAQLVKQLVPSVPTGAFAGLGRTDSAAFAHYLNAAPMEVEEVSGAPMTIEQGVAGLASVFG